MALSLQQRGALLTDSVFRSRVQVCVLNLATYIVGLGGSEPGSRQKWADRMLTGTGAAQCAADLMPQLVNHATVTGSSAGDGSDISDANLGTAVESVCEFYG